MSFELIIKDGSQEYKFDAKSGSGKYKTVDDVRTFDNLAEALAEFLYLVGDIYNEDKAILKYTPDKKKKKK